MLTPRQQLFAAEYVVDLNATQAAIRAGYSPATAEQQGCRLLRNAQVAAAVREAHAKRLEAADLTAARVLEEIRRIAFATIGDLYDDAGCLRPVKSLPPEVQALIASIETDEIWEGQGDSRKLVGHTRKVKLWDKGRHLEMAAKHLSLLVDRSEVHHSGTIEHKVAQMTPEQREQRGLALVAKARGLLPPPANAA
jgi:phage terminase small subunit